MIAMLLAAQLSAEIVRGMPADVIVPPRAGLIRIVPGPQPKACANAGRFEASLAEPTALYRKGDRPAVGLRKWADYPEGQRCLIGGAR
jgi:hypothetical protein